MKKHGVILVVWLVLLLPFTQAMAATFQTIDGEVVIEAEQYTNTLGSICTWKKMDGYMQSSDDNPSTTNFKPSTCRLEYEINFNEKGTYYLHLRTLAEDHFQNGFFATLDGKEIDYGGVNPKTGKTADYIYVEKIKQWSWYTDGGGTEGRDLVVKVNVHKTGKQTFALYRRDKNSKVDRIWLTKNDATIYKASDLDLTDAEDFIVGGGPPGPGPVPGPGPDPDPVSHHFNPVTDAYLQGSVRHNNQQLRIDKKNNRVSFLKFNVSDVSGDTIEQAILRLRVRKDAGFGPMSVYLGDSNNWNERNLTPNNAPKPVGAALAAINEVYGVDEWYEFDVTNAVKGAGNLSFILQKDTADNDVAFGSKECPDYEPELVINAGSSQSEEITLTLIDAQNNQDIGELNDNAVIDLKVDGDALNIRADVDGTLDAMGVRFILDGEEYSMEENAPFALAGDKAGDYNAWTPSEGSHTLRAIALNGDQELADRTLHFTVKTNGGREIFQKERGDLISLHYDFMPDPDDGHAAVAARTVTGHFGIVPHVVSGTHSFPTTRHNSFIGPYQPSSVDVMRAAWGKNWYNAHNNSNPDVPSHFAVSKTALKWRETLNKGGHVWIAEGGPSDFTYDALKYLKEELNYNFKHPRRIHLVQHGAEPCKAGSNLYRLNERNTGVEKLKYVKNHTDYHLIGNGNCSQNNFKYVPTANFRAWLKRTPKTVNRFMAAATANNSKYRKAWVAAFKFFNPDPSKPQTALKSHGADRKYHALDFSDTVELMHIIGMDRDEVPDIDTFRKVFF